MDGRARPLRFVEFEGGCMIPLSHRFNQDGYFRKAWGNERAGDRLVLFMHRAIYMEVHGEIPEGYEVDHLCRTRSCCNPAHLQLLTRSEHSVKTNKERYAARNSEAKAYWELTGCTGESLGKRFGVSATAACRWIRKWRNDNE